MNTCQKMSADDLYKTVRNLRATYRNQFDRLNQSNEWLQNADAATYPTTEIDTATLAAIAALRTALGNYLESAETVALLAAVNNLRHMN